MASDKNGYNFEVLKNGEPIGKADSLSHAETIVNVFKKLTPSKKTTFLICSLFKSKKERQLPLHDPNNPKPT